MPTFLFQNHRIARLVLLFTAVALAPGTAPASGPTLPEVITVIGTSAIEGGNIPGARNQAISNGLVSVISRSVESLLPLDAWVTHFKDLDQAFYSDPERFIQDYKVLTESVSGKEYRVMIQATVAVEGMRQRLLAMGLGAEERTMPAVLFFIAEQDPVKILPVYWWGEDPVFVLPASEKIMTDTLRIKGAPIVDHGAMIRNRALEPPGLKFDITAREAVAVGLRLKADVVVLGRAITEKMPNIMGSNLKSFRASITANAFRTDTGEQIAATHQSVTVVNTDDVAGSRDALTQTAKLAGDEIASQIAGAWLKDRMQPTQVEIQVQGTRHLAKFVEFRRKISELAGVGGIQIKEIQPDAALITVDFQGNARALARALMLKPFEAFGITISELSDDKLKIELIPQ